MSDVDTNRQAASTGVDLESSPRAAAAAARNLSAWRMPETPGGLPLYVQRNCRVKTFSLLSIQLLVVFGLMLLCHFVVETYLEKTLKQSLDYVVGALTMLEILLFRTLKDVYPWNYALLSIATLLVGCFLGITDLDFGVHLHFQVIGMLATSMVVTTGMVAVLTRESIHPKVALVASHGLGWMVASGADLLLFSICRPCVSLRWCLLAVLIASVVLVGVFFVDLGGVHRDANPDDVFRFIVAMDAALLVVGLPLCVCACCLIQFDLKEEQANENAAAASADASVVEEV